MMHHADPFDGSLLDVDDSGSFPSLLHYLSEHSSSITGLLTFTRSCSTNSIFISSSLDGTCKVSLFIQIQPGVVILLNCNFLFMGAKFHNL